MAAASCRLLYDEWRKEDAELYTTSAAAIRSLSTSGAPAYCQMLHPYVRSAQGDYHGAVEIADAAIEQVAESASPTVYLLALGVKAMSWLHLGRFRDVLRIVRTGREVSEKNDMDPWIFIFREAWLRTLCFDFEGARELGLSHWLPRATRNSPGRITIKRWNVFRRVLDISVTRNFFLHWHWRIQARLGACMAWLGAGDMPNARAEAARCLEAAGSTADPNLKALALKVSARTAFAGQHRPDARRCLENAIAMVKEFDLPGSGLANSCRRVGSSGGRCRGRTASDRRQRSRLEDREFPGRR